MCGIFPLQLTSQTHLCSSPIRHPCLPHPTHFTFFPHALPPAAKPPPSISSPHRSIHHTLGTRASSAPASLREVRIMPLIWVYARTLVPYPSPARRDTADLPECCVNTGGVATCAPHCKTAASASTRSFTPTGVMRAERAEGEELLSVCNSRRWQ